MDRDTPDEDLMLRYADGDSAAFEMLYARHKGGLFRFLLRQCSQRAHAEEMFQDIWLNLINARERYRVEAKFTTYLYRLAHNRLIDYYRRNAHEALRSFEEDDSIFETVAAPDLSPETKVELAQQIKIFLSLLERLPAAQREAFVLHEEAGLSLDEIANVTHTSRETAKSRLRYARAKLKEGLEKTYAYFKTLSNEALHNKEHNDFTNYSKK